MLTIIGDEKNKHWQSYISLPAYLEVDRAIVTSYFHYRLVVKQRAIVT